MKILHVIPSFAPAWRYGGPIIAAAGLTREQARQGHDVAVMTTNIDGPGTLDVPLDRPVLRDGVKVWYFPIQHPRYYCFSRPLGRALQSQVEHYEVVHIHSVFLWPTTVGAYWCRRNRVPYIVRPAGALDPKCLSKSYDRWWVSLSSRIKKSVYLKTVGMWDLQRASAIHFTAQAEMEAVRPLGLRPPSVVVPLGVELAQVEGTPDPMQLRERYPQLEGKKVVLFLSRLDPKKGLDLLIPALGRLAVKRNDFGFVVAGGGTRKYEAALVSLVFRHGLRDRTIFLGPVDGHGKWSLLRQADLLVLPSYQENFGLVVVEAMAAGLPVILSDGVNINREVSQAGAGLVVGLRVEEIASAVEQLLADDGLRRELGHRGSLLAHEHFGWEKVTKEMVKAYERVTRSPGEPARMGRHGADGEPSS